MELSLKQLLYSYNSLIAIIKNTLSQKKNWFFDDSEPLASKRQPPERGGIKASPSFLQDMMLLAIESFQTAIQAASWQLHKLGGKPSYMAHKCLRLVSATWIDRVESNNIPPTQIAWLIMLSWSPGKIAVSSLGFEFEQSGSFSVVPLGSQQFSYINQSENFSERRKQEIKNQLVGLLEYKLSLYSSSYSDILNRNNQINC